MTLSGRYDTPTSGVIRVMDRDGYLIAETVITPDGSFTLELPSRVHPNPFPSLRLFRWLPG